MNAVSNSGNDFIQENFEGSDSDTNGDDLPEYYQPIAGGDDEPSDSDINSDDDPDFTLANGYAHDVANGMSSIDLSYEENGNNDQEEEEERVTEASDSAALRAFREDESRRSAPLTPETATRVMEAMRGISFSGLVPDWADRVPEDQLINQQSDQRIRRILGGFGVVHLRETANIGSHGPQTSLQSGQRTTPKF